MLVAVALSAQATDVSVNKATEPLFKIADTPEKMLALGEAGLKQHIKTIGLYNAKAKNVITTGTSNVTPKASSIRVEKLRYSLIMMVGAMRRL